MLLRLINPLLKDRFPPKTGLSNAPLKSISESIRKLELFVFKVNVFVVILISDLSESLLL